MLNRTAKLAPAIIAGVFVGVTLTPMFNHAARAANDCLSGPNDQTPPGGHWYYRIDHATKRHCWYLGDKQEKISRAAPKILTLSSTTVSPRQETASRSIADARAEFTVPQTQFETPRSNDPSLSVKPVDRANVEISQPTNLTAANTERSIVASRWPEPSLAVASVDPAPNEADFVEAGGPAPIDTFSPRATADASPATPAYSRQLELSALLGAFMLAGILGSVAFKLGSSGSFRPGRTRVRRDTIWQPADEDKISLPRAYTDSRRSRFANDLDRARRNDRIAEFFSELSRGAPT
jgi:hypothetical protein